MTPIHLLLVSVSTALIAGVSGSHSMLLPPLAYRLEMSMAESWTQKHFVSSSAPTQPPTHTTFYNPQTTAWPRFHNTTRSSEMLDRTSTRTTRPTASVTVGKAGMLQFSPSTLDAAVGSIVSFNFLALNHTLTQSEFWNPCQPNGEFDSGFKQFNPWNSSGEFIVDYEVTVESPQWFFCSQTFAKSHCQAGMVFSLNSHGAHNSFLRNAMAAVEVTSSPIPSNQTCHQTAYTLVSGRPSATGSLIPQSSGAAVHTTPINPPISNEGTTIQVGALAAVVVGGLFL